MLRRASGHGGRQDVLPAGAGGALAGRRQGRRRRSLLDYQNIDLFGGNAQEIIAIGYAVGAFHVASFLAHPEFQPQDSDLAGAVLVSGIYKSSADGGDGERAYFGTDPSKYDERSALPGLLSVQLPLMLAWSVTDPRRASSPRVRC